MTLPLSNKVVSLALLVLLSSLLQQRNHVEGFTPTPMSTVTTTLPARTISGVTDVIRPRKAISWSILQQTAKDNDPDADAEEEEEEERTEGYQNPYQDPNYPELEFIDYSDPNYSVDQGVGDEMFAAREQDKAQTEAEIEQMRESRRRRNDEFQFQTFFANVMKGSENVEEETPSSIPYCGEWTIYETSTFWDPPEPANEPAPPTEPEQGPPRLRKVAQPWFVMSTAEKVTVEDQQEDEESVTPETDRQRILYTERRVSPQFVQAALREKSDETNVDEGFGRLQSGTSSMMNKQDEEEMPQDSTILNAHWPAKPLKARDFRGPQGIMCVSNAYTVATAVPINDKNKEDEDNNEMTGPFAEYRCEVGLTTRQWRFRIKLDYQILDQKSNTPPPLHLKSLIVCREVQGAWLTSAGQREFLSSPTWAAAQEALFGIPGADNGLYDPPPVGSDERAAQYLQLDLDGHATALFPYIMEQDEPSSDDDGDASMGWVMALDWTPHHLRYQVDRKIQPAPYMVGLRTLELSEVQSNQAEQYRPRDGGQNMRQ